MSLQLRGILKALKKISVFKKTEVYFLSTESSVGGLGLLWAHWPQAASPLLCFTDSTDLMAQDGSSHVPENKTEEAMEPEDSKVTLLTFLYTSCWSECSHRTSAELERGPFPGGSAVKTPTANSGDVDLVPGSGRSPGGGNATHSCILAWKIPQTEESGGLQSTGS